MIAYQLRLLQCCLVTYGGGALILVAAERQELLHHTGEGRYPWQKWVPACAGKTSKRANPIASHRRKGRNADGGFHSSRAFRGARAEAAITHRDVDHLMHLRTYGTPCRRAFGRGGHRSGPGDKALGTTRARSCHDRKRTSRCDQTPTFSNGSATDAVIRRGSTSYPERKLMLAGERRPSISSTLPTSS